MCKDIPSFLHQSGLAIPIKDLQELIANSFQNYESINSTERNRLIRVEIIKEHIRYFGFFHFAMLANVNLEY